MRRTTTKTASGMDRRQAIRLLASISAGLSVGCTPLRILSKAYPREFDRDQDRVDSILGAFAEAIVPGVDTDYRRLAQPFRDPYYPLTKYRGFFTSDLSDRARDLFGTGRFDALSVEQRTEVIQSALDSGGIMERLYTGAIFLTQIAFYAGLCDPQAACRAIGFKGPFRGGVNLSHDECKQYLARAVTTDGNPA